MSSAHVHGRRRHHGGLIAVIVIVVVLALLAVAFFLTDPLIRSAAEKSVASDVQKQLPNGVTAKDLRARIDGAPVLYQYVTGRFSKVVLTSEDVEARGIRLTARLTALGVPVDRSKPVKQLDGTFTVGQSDVDHLVTVPGVKKGSVILRKGSVEFSPTFTVLGIDISPIVTAKVAVDWPDVTFKATRFSVSSNRAQLDVTRIVKSLLGDNPIRVCIAQYLPGALRATGIDVESGSVTATVTGRDVVLAPKTIESLGSCG